MEDHEPRTVGVFCVHQRRATSVAPVFGVKGRSELANILTLPTCLAFDVMHLCYHGVARSFLCAALKMKKVDAISLSDLIEKFKVPHDFKRKPRNLTTELKLWKSQEHQHFLLYFGPIAFFILVSLEKSCPDLFITYYYLSVAVFVLSSEKVLKSDLPLCKRIIVQFQRMISNLFGRSVCTMSTHALFHLPEQVEKMGPLTSTSATTFENLLRVLKQSVTGSKGQPHQMLSRFYLKQSCDVKATSFIVKPLGRLHLLDDRLRNVCSDFNLSVTSFVERFSSNGKVFHAYSHGRRLKSASYFAYLEAVQTFVKIKFVFVSGDDLYCVCREFCKVSKLHCDLPLPTDDSDFMNLLSPYFLLTKGDLVCHPGISFTHHAIIFKHDVKVFDVRVLKNWEHE
ncbi:MAG: hypothetical protein AAGK05_12615 [Pseudomonadota bacterium]